MVDKVVDGVSFSYKYASRLCVASATIEYEENGEQRSYTYGCPDLYTAFLYGSSGFADIMVNINLNRDVATIDDLAYGAGESPARTNLHISSNGGYRKDVFLNQSVFNISGDLNWCLSLNQNVTLTSTKPLIASDGNPVPILPSYETSYNYIYPSFTDDETYLYDPALTPKADGWYEVGTDDQFRDAYGKEESSIKIRLVSDIVLEEIVDYEGPVNNRKIYLDTNNHSISFLSSEGFRRFSLRKGDVLYTKEKLESSYNSNYFDGIIVKPNKNEYKHYIVEQGHVGFDIDSIGYAAEQRILYPFEYASDEEGFSYMYRVEYGAATYENEQKDWDNPGEYIVTVEKSKNLVDAIESALLSAKKKERINVDLLRDINTTELLWGNYYQGEIPSYGVDFHLSMDSIKEEGYPNDEITININCGNYSINPGVNWNLLIGEGIVIVTDNPVDWIKSDVTNQKIEADTTTESGRYVYKIKKPVQVEGWFQVSSSEQFITAYNSNQSPVYIELTDSFTLQNSPGWRLSAPKTVYLALGDNSISFKGKNPDESTTYNMIWLNKNDVIYSDKPIRDASDTNPYAEAPIYYNDYSYEELPKRYYFIEESTVNIVADDKTMLYKYVAKECAATTTGQIYTYEDNVETITFGCGSFAEALNAGYVINEDFVNVNVIRDLYSLRDFWGHEPDDGQESSVSCGIGVTKPYGYKKDIFTVNLYLNNHTISLENNRKWFLMLEPGITLVSDTKLPLVWINAKGTSSYQTIIPDTTSIPGKYVYVATNESKEQFQLTINAGNGTYNGKKTSTINCFSGQKLSDILNPKNLKSSDAKKEFSYWSTDQKGKKPVDPDSFVIDGNMTLYAQYRQITFTVILDANEGFFGSLEETTFSTTALKGKKLSALPKVDPTSQDKDKCFVGWALDPDGTERIANLKNYIPTGNMTIFAVYDDHVLKVIPGVAATCLKAGKTEGSYCTRCKKNIVEVEVIDALGHDEYIIEGTPATCTKTGLTDGRNCSRCGKVIEAQKKIPLKDHNWEEDYTEDLAPTCTKTGKESIHCADCGAIKKGSSRTLDKTPHTYGEWTVIKEPTCTKKGTETNTCAICKRTEKKDIPALGHDWSEDYTVDKQPTCKAAGSQSHHCTRCNAKEPKSDVAIPKADHEPGDWVVTKKPTTTATGTRVKKCKYCSKVLESEVIDMLPRQEQEAFTVTVKTPSVKASALAKKAQTITATKAFTAKNAKGKVSYARVSGNDPLTISSAGLITVAKGTAAGDYQITVDVTAAGDKNYNPKTEQVTVTVTVN